MSQTVHLIDQYPRQFLLFVERVILAETGGKGDGWSNHESDLGQATQWGISSLANPDLADLIVSRKLSYEQAVQRYFVRYYRSIIGVDQLDPRLVYIIFDAKVHGAKVTIEFIQKWLNTQKNFKLAVDGIYGKATASALMLLSTEEVSQLISLYVKQAKDLAKEMARRVKIEQKRRGVKVYDYSRGFTNRLLARGNFAKDYVYA